MSEGAERGERLEAMRQRLLAIARTQMEEEMLDSILIVATYRENGTTSRITAYQGNWYANTGAAREFLKCAVEDDYE